jgi:hypothetical protein
MKLITVGFLLIACSSIAQNDSTIRSRDSSWIIHYSKAYNDSVLALLIKSVPKSKREGYKEFFDSMTDDQRSFFYAISLPVTGKKELIQNLNANYGSIKAAIILFKELFPLDLDVYIEFKPPQKFLRLGESVDFWCSRNSKSGGTTPLFHEWNVEVSSAQLDSLLRLIHMDRNKLEQLHTALLKAHCISIKSGNPAEVGFARSGMAKYDYLIFDDHLTKTQMKRYNNGCEYIFYKDNIVLEHAIGAVGSPCFPYEEPE